MSGSALGQLTGTTSFAPSLGESTLYALARCGVMRTAITQQHMQNATMAANLILSDWANDQVNLWKVVTNTITLTEGVSTYSLPSSTILLLEGLLRLNAGQTNQFDFFLWPLSRTEYASFPDKTTPGRTTVYWYDRLTSPTVTLWQPPSDATWQFVYYGVVQMDDAAMANGGIIDVPYYFLKAFSDRLSAELAVIYAPDRAVALGQQADKSYEKALNRNAETVALSITPGLSGYFTI